MKVSELQEKIRGVENLIRKKMDPPFDMDVIRCLKAQEELGEVSDVLVGMKAGSRKGKISQEEGKERLSEEIADTICLLIGIANSYDINLEKALKKKFKETKEEYEKIEEIGKRK